MRIYDRGAGHHPPLQKARGAIMTRSVTTAATEVRNIAIGLKTVEMRVKIIAIGKTI